jgi:DNA polymerase III epsilon subunit-like protein
MLLFFDTETTGLPRDYKATWSNVANWPRLVTISWVVTDSRGVELRSQHTIIRPDGYEIPPASTKIHGVTHQVAVDTGEPARRVLERFHGELRRAAAIVAHNYNFDTGVIGAEYFRQSWTEAALRLEAMAWRCTMVSSINVCKLPGKFGDYKYPGLAELHRHLFGSDFGDAHNSLADTRACAKCFFEMRRRGYLDGAPPAPKPAPARVDPTVAAIEELLG